MCIKSDFEQIILKLATYGQREKAFLLSSKFCPQGVVCPCPGATYMYKSIKIYTRTRCQVSVYRTTGPLVIMKDSDGGLVIKVNIPKETAKRMYLCLSYDVASESVKPLSHALKMIIS